MNEEYLRTLLLDAVFEVRCSRTARQHRERALSRRLRAARYPAASWDAVHLRKKADESDRAAERALAGYFEEATP